ISRLCEVALNCENAKEAERYGKSCWLGDPMEVALIDFAKAANGATALVYPRVDEIPFDSDRKRLSTVHQVSDRQALFCKGAVETVLPLCTSAYVDSSIITLSDEMRESFLRA